MPECPGSEDEWDEGWGDAEDRDASSAARGADATVTDGYNLMNAWAAKLRGPQITVAQVTQLTDKLMHDLKHLPVVFPDPPTYSPAEAAEETANEGMYDARAEELLSSLVHLVRVAALSFLSEAQLDDQDPGGCYQADQALRL